MKTSRVGGVKSVDVVGLSWIVGLADGQKILRPRQRVAGGIVGLRTLQNEEAIDVYVVEGAHIGGIHAADQSRSGAIDGGSDTKQLIGGHSHRQQGRTSAAVYLNGIVDAFQQKAIADCDGDIGRFQGQLVTLVGGTLVVMSQPGEAKSAGCWIHRKAGSGGGQQGIQSGGKEAAVQHR